MEVIGTIKENCRHSIQRWVILIPFLLYVAFFVTTWMFSMPLRSVNRHEVLFSRLVKQGKFNSLVNAGKDLGKEIVADSLKTGGSQDQNVLITDIFTKADTDKNSLLNVDELSNWINLKIHEHIQQAMEENYELFNKIDINPKNGMISWDEYHTYFLRERGMSQEYAQKHDEKHRDLARPVKETIMRDRASWSEAARSDPDHLTVDEFLAFRHPESSHSTILSMVEELFDKFDRDEDEMLTEEEFSSLPAEVENEMDEDMKKQSENERRKEFREVIDQNKDGKADRKELVLYIDPKNPRHGREEAETLMALADVNQDNNLSLPEILNKIDLFLSSKMVDTAKSFHDEF